MKRIIRKRDVVFFIVFFIAFLILFQEKVYSQEYFQEDKAITKEEVVSEFVETLFKPITIIPTALIYAAKMGDWRSSQALFELGYCEVNPRYTLNGNSLAKPVSYKTGVYKIRRETIRIYGSLVLGNTFIGLAEDKFEHKYPNRKKLIRYVSTAAKIGFSAFITYQSSHAHFKQWMNNIKMVQNPQPSIAPRF